MSQNEILSPLSILDEKGQPHNFGWSKVPYFFYDPDLLYVLRHRVSESDRYMVHTPTHMIVFEICDDGLLGHMAVSVISLRDKKRSTQIYPSLMPMGSYQMPNNSDEGNATWRKKKNLLNFILMDGGARIIKIDVRDFGRHRSLRGALVLTPPQDCQSLITNQPWRNENKAFRYSRCSPWFNVEGMIQFGSSEIIFNRGNAWGIMDWYRSVRPKADVCYWAQACGMSSAVHFSFCVGYSGADFSQGTENGFFVDGKLHKLDQVTFHIPLSNWLSEWRFTSNDNRLEMIFHPHQERTDRRGLFFYNSARRQVFGFFSGKVQLDDGSIVEFNNLTGFAERTKTQL